MLLLNNILKNYKDKMYLIQRREKISFHIKIIQINIGLDIIQVDLHLKDMLKE